MWVIEPSHRLACVALALWASAITAFAQMPTALNYAAFSDKDGRITSEEHANALLIVLRDPEKLEAVYADAVKGNVRAGRVFQELETSYFPDIGREVADLVNRPPCLVPLIREVSGWCLPNWAFVSFLDESRPGGAGLRKALFDGFAQRARERRLENKLILSSMNALLGMRFAASAVREAEAVAGSIRAPPAPMLRVGSGKTLSGATTKLYRAVDEAELKQLLETGKFHAGPNSLGGKWFAESAADAATWGARLSGHGKFRVVEVELPKSIADQLIRRPRLDAIGPARYAELDQLQGAVIREVK